MLDGILVQKRRDVVGCVDATEEDRMVVLVRLEGGSGGFVPTMHS